MDFVQKGLKKFHHLADGHQQNQQPLGGDARDDTDDEKLDQHGRFERGEGRAIYPQPGHVNQAAGQMPPQVANLDYRGKMRFFKPDGSPHNVLRDLGFSGVIDGKVVWCWGDTLMGTQKKSMICANDSTSIGSVKRPMMACDTSMEQGHVKQWIPATEEEKHQGGIVRYGYGGTNIIEYAPNKGLVYYLKNDRKGGGGDIRGAGVALVHMEGDIPHARRVHDTLWGPKQPKYGDVGITYDPRDRHVYVYGHGPDGDKELVSRTYLCRVPAEEATDLSKYEYWMNDERKWVKERHNLDRSGGCGQLTQKMAVFDWWVMNQSAPFWSNHFNKWMILYGDCFGFSDIKCKTADHLEGPWADHGQIAKTDPKPGAPLEKAFRYCQTGHPWVDETGKKVLVTWTRANWIWGVMVTWE